VGDAESSVRTVAVTDGEQSREVLPSARQAKGVSGRPVTSRTLIVSLSTQFTAVESDWIYVRPSRCTSMPPIRTLFGKYYTVQVTVA
jgi:hypothetical protein